MQKITWKRWKRHQVTGEWVPSCYCQQSAVCIWLTCSLWSNFMCGSLRTEFNVTRSEFRTLSLCSSRVVFFYSQLPNMKFKCFHISKSCLFSIKPSLHFWQKHFEPVGRLFESWPLERWCRWWCWIVVWRRCLCASNYADRSKNLKFLIHSHDNILNLGHITQEAKFVWKTLSIP